MAIHATGRQADEPGLEYRRPRRRTSASAHQQRRQVPYLCRDLHAREQALYYRGHRAGGLPGAGVVSAIAGMARREWDRASLSVCLLQRIPGAPAGQACRAALTARGESLAAFDERCIPSGGVAPPSNTPGILSRRALPAGRLARLGATPDFHHGLLTGGAGSRTPLGAIRLFLEMRARDERLQEVLGIVDDGRYGEPLIAVRLGVAIVVFGQRGALTVGHAVLSQISGLEVRRDDLQRAAPRQRRSAAPGAAASGSAAAAARTRITRHSRVVCTLNDAASGDDAATEAATATAAWRSARDFPRRRRITLPARFSGWRLRLAEAQQTGLLAGVCFDLQRVVVLPGDVDAPWHAHDVGRAVCPALIAARRVLRRIPRVDHLAALVVQRHTREITFRRRDHPIAPIFRDHRDPVAGEIDRRRGPGVRRRRGRAVPTALSIEGSRGRHREPDDSDPSSQ